MASLVTPLRPNLAGGAQAFVSDLAAGLNGLGHEVTLHCAEGSEVEGVKMSQVAVDPGVGAALVRPLESPGAPLPALRAGFQALFETVRQSRPDAVSQHAFDAEAVELSENLPVLHTLHLPPLAGPMLEACLRSRARFATVSEGNRRLWQSAGLTVLDLLPNGVPDLPVETPLPPSRRAVIAGRVSPEKGVVAGVQAARRAGLAVDLYGDPYDAQYFREAVAPLLGPEVCWRGAVPRRALREALARASVCLMAVEWDEPFGLVAAESQLAGCPVVAYRRGGLPEVVEDGVGGVLVEPGDFAALVRGVARALALDRGQVRASALRRLAMTPVLHRYASSLENLAEERRG